MNFYILLLSFFTLVYSLGKQGNGQDSPTTTSQTMVWFTTTINGTPTTFSTAYSQKFTIDSTSVGTNVKSGEIGLGSIGGSVGSIREYSSVTITPNDAPRGNTVGGTAGLLGLLGLFAAVIGLL